MDSDCIELLSDCTHSRGAIAPSAANDTAESHPQSGTRPKVSPSSLQAQKLPVFFPACTFSCDVPRSITRVFVSHKSTCACCADRGAC